MTYPAVALPNQWTNTYVTDADMHNRIDVPMNAIGDYMSTWGEHFPLFRAINAVNPGALNTNIGFSTIVEDFVDPGTGTGSGWDAVNKRYVVQVTGLYLVQFGWCQASAVAGAFNILGLPSPFQPNEYTGLMAPAAVTGTDFDASVSLTAGAQIRVQAVNALPTAATVTNTTLSYLTIAMIGF